MELASQILSDITVYMKYARYLPERTRRETWKELVTRNKAMHLKQYPSLKKEIDQTYKFVYDKKILPSMRSMQFAGKSIEISPNRIYNCAYLPIDHPRAFSEVMFLLLGGTGIGYSVQRHHVEKLPPIHLPRKDRKRRFLIGDSIEGWADAIKVLMRSYFEGTPRIQFDFSDIRPKGALLITSGGKAPGPQPLKDCVHNIRKVLDAKSQFEQLLAIEVHDIVCYIADAVLAGGIRRAALISLFSADDERMMTCKYGNWWELSPQRGRANNSVVLMRHRIKKDKFMELWRKVELSKCGEPGIYLSNDKELGTNPCCEIALRAFQFCNLVEVNGSNIESQEDLNERTKAAAFIGTLQAGYTEFHYLRDIWQETTEKEALLGIGMTGIASDKVTKCNLTEAADIAKEENARVAKIIGVNKAARVTTVKPSGTSSMVLGTSSGIHAWHSHHYIRRIRVGKNESIYQYLVKKHPELVEDDFFRAQEQAVISIPQKAPWGSIVRTETSIDLLERVRRFSEEWVRPGHHSGSNTHNVSATISIKDDEWKEIGEWMWKNRDCYNGLSVLPHDGGTYVQAPFEECTKYMYDKMMDSLTKVDLTKIIEAEDNTDLQAEPACAGGACEVDFETPKSSNGVAVKEEDMSVEPVRIDR